MSYATDADRSLTDYPNTTVEPTLQWYRALLLIAIVLTTYTSIPFVSGGRLLVPSFPTVALTPLLFLAVWPSISLADVMFLLKLTFVLILTIALSPGYEHLEAKFLTLAQCCMAIFVALLTVRLMLQLRRDLLERILFVLWAAVVIGSILEILGAISEISDSFREWAYGSAFTVYEGVDRDINLVGWPRPKLFTTEPSHVTKFFVVAINSWLLVRVSWIKVGITTGATLFMLVIMGSPSLLVSAAVTVAIVLWDQRTSTHSKTAMVLATILIGALFAMYLGLSSYSVVSDRLANVNLSPTKASELGSEEQRIVYPYMVLADAWQRWPLFGVGMGGKDVIFENSKIAVPNADAAIGKNVLAESLIYLGLIGGALFLYVLLKHIRSSGVNRIGLFVVIVAMFSQLIAGMATFRYWGFIALFWGAMAAVDSQTNKHNTR
jgi:hypothetical protein